MFTGRGMSIYNLPSPYITCGIILVGIFLYLIFKDTVLALKVQYTNSATIWSSFLCIIKV